MSNSHSNWLSLIACLALIGGGVITGCNQEEELLTGGDPSVELSVVSVDASTATLNLTSSGISDYAYVVYSDSEKPETDPAAVTIYRDGVTGTCSDGENAFTVTGLSPLTDYTLYLAATATSGAYYDDVVTASFTTTDYSADLTLVETYYDGFTMQIRMPEEVTERGNVLRYTMGNLLMYNSNKNGWMASTDALTLESNGGQYTDASVSVTYNDDNIYTGEVDEWGEEVYLHDPIVPGEPLIFLVGEFAWGESNYGWGEGWYSALFDDAAYQDALLTSAGEVDEADYWTGHYARQTFTSRSPETLDATVGIETDMQAVSGTINFTPEDGVYQYCVCLLDEASYQMVLEYLNGEEDYMQWFTTSYYASAMLGMRTFTGNQSVNVSDYLYLSEDTEYHILLTAMGDEEGTTQSYIHQTFRTTPKQLAAPEVTVTAIDNPSGTEDPYEVWFNIKNTGDVEVASAMYAANYVRDWEGALNMGMYYSDIIAQGNAFTSAEVAAINSDEGLDVSFTTIDGMTTRLGVLAYNSEETANDVNSEGSPAIAEATSIDQPDADRVESGLFDSLVGDWTMTASVSLYDYYEGGYVDEGEQSIKVSIYNGLDDYPETLPSEVYDNYSDMSTEEVDALYDEFKMEAEAFNAKVRGQNRLLCLGFGYDEDGSTSLSAATPYELFCSPEYSGYDVPSLFYDFGPKWYLQVASDGTVSVPLNSTRMYPLQAWTDNIYYLAAYNSDSGYVSVGEDDENAYIPATVSSDNGTVTVGPMVRDEVEYYPNAVYIYYASYAYLGGKRIDTAPVLTKGWSGDAVAQSASSSPRKPSVQVESSNGMPLMVSSAARPKSRTSFIALKKYERSDYRIVPAGEFEESLKAYSSNHKR